MSGVRPPAVAGLFYPDDPEELLEFVGHAIDVPVPEDEPLPKGIIVPHAGYAYSGPTAGVAYARLKRLRGAIQRVVLLGPAHRPSVDGIAVSEADAFGTPLGAVSVDAALRERVLALAAARADDHPHAGEHALEVQLPFLQVTLGTFRVLPLAVGETRPGDVARTLDAIWGGAETLVVVSSDLSHYHSYAAARVRDARTAAAIVAADEAAIADDDACGARPLRGVLLAARRRGLGIRLLDLRSSGDTAGDRDRVVGYGAFLLEAAAGGQ